MPDAESVQTRPDSADLEAAHTAPDPEAVHTTPDPERVRWNGKPKVIPADDRLRWSGVPQPYSLHWNALTPCTRTPYTTYEAAAAAALETPTTPTCRLFVIRSPNVTVTRLSAGNDETNEALCRDMVLDPAFLAAHDADLRYRPAESAWRPKFSDGHCKAASYVYPQVEKREAEIDATAESAEASAHDCSVAVFCRVSVWTGPCAAVLVLDASPPSTALEEALIPALDDTAATLGATPNGAAVAALLHRIVPVLAFEQWSDFFDTLGVRRACANRTLYWDMAQYLEQNLAATRIHEKKNRRRHQHHEPTAPDTTLDLDEVTPGDWMDLLSRLGRIAQLLPLVHDQEDHGLSLPPPPYTRLPAVPPNGSVAFDNTNGSQSQESLSRVTYMGGILLPFSIVAGIMSMSDPFGPGEHLFWVFWVITIPLTAAVLLFIYADQIAKMDVWKPMDHKSLQEAIRRGEAAAVSAIETATHAGPVRRTYYRLPDSPTESSSRPNPGASGDEWTLDATRPSQFVEVTMSARKTRKMKTLAAFLLFPIALPVFFVVRWRRRSAAETATSPAGFAANGSPGPVEVAATAASASLRPAEAEDQQLPPAATLAANAPPRIFVQQQPDGTMATAWRRQKLGYGGAIKKILGYESVHRA